MTDANKIAADAAALVKAVDSALEVASERAHATDDEHLAATARWGAMLAWKRASELVRIAADEVKAAAMAQAEADETITKGSKP